MHIVKRHEGTKLANDYEFTSLSCFIEAQTSIDTWALLFDSFKCYWKLMFQPLILRHISALTSFLILGVVYLGFGFSVSIALEK